MSVWFICMAVGVTVAVLMFMGMFHNCSVFQNVFVEMLIFAFVHDASVYSVLRILRHLQQYMIGSFLICLIGRIDCMFLL